MEYVWHTVFRKCLRSFWESPNTWYSTDVHGSVHSSLVRSDNCAAKVWAGGGLLHNFLYFRGSPEWFKQYNHDNQVHIRLLTLSCADTSANKYGTNLSSKNNFAKPEMFWLRIYQTRQKLPHPWPSWAAPDSGKKVGCTTTTISEVGVTKSVSSDLLFHPFYQITDYPMNITFIFDKFHRSLDTWQIWMWFKGSTYSFEKLQMTELRFSDPNPGEWQEKIIFFGLPALTSNDLAPSDWNKTNLSLTCIPFIIIMISTSPFSPFQIFLPRRKMM